MFAAHTDAAAAHRNTLRLTPAQSGRWTTSEVSRAQYVARAQHTADTRGVPVYIVDSRALPLMTVQPAVATAPAVEVEDAPLDFMGL